MIPPSRTRTTFVTTSRNSVSLSLKCLYTVCFETAAVGRDFVHAGPDETIGEEDLLSRFEDRRSLAVPARGAVRCLGLL